MTGVLASLQCAQAALPLRVSEFQRPETADARNLALRFIMFSFLTVYKTWGLHEAPQTHYGPSIHGLEKQAPVDIAVRMTADQPTANPRKIH